MSAFASARALEAVTRRLEGPLLRAWNRAVRDLETAAQAQRAAVLRAIADGDAGRVVELLFDGRLGAPVARTLENAIADAVHTAGRIAASDAPALRVADERRAVRVAMLYGPVDPRALEAVDGVVARMVAPIAEEWRAAVAAAVREGLEAGLGPRAIARRLPAAFALTPYDRAVVQSFADALADGRFADALSRELRDRRFDRTLARLAEDGGELDAARRARMVDRYRERLRAWRARTWARTAANNAARAGEWALWQSYDDRGIAGEVRRMWITAADERVRPAHRAMNGRVVAIDDAFTVPGVGAQRYPGESEWNCRCTVLYVPATASRRELARLARGAGRVTRRPVTLPDDPFAPPTN